MANDVFKNISFIKSASKVSDLPRDPNKIEYAFWGRSNVGKSSLLNALANKKIAKTSNTPGRTQLLNFFALSNNIHLVDMPGYGFASAPKAEREKWEALIYDYLTSRPNLKRVFLLIDARHGIIKTDREILDFLNSVPIPFQIILTKADKISASTLADIEHETFNELKNFPAAYPTLVTTSSEKGLGISLLRKTLFT